MGMRLSGLVFSLVIAAIPAQAAESGGGDPSSDSGTYRFDLDSGLSALKGLLSMADLYLNEYFDLDGQIHPGTSQDNRWGKLHFKFYPEGRSRSENGIDADTWFKSEDGQFSFHFKFRDPKQSSVESERQL